jgi:hypothetical protein
VWGGCGVEAASVEWCGVAGRVALKVQAGDGDGDGGDKGEV